MKDSGATGTGSLRTSRFSSPLASLLPLDFGRHLQIYNLQIYKEIFRTGRKLGMGKEIQLIWCPLHLI